MSDQAEVSILRKSIIPNLLEDSFKPTFLTEIDDEEYCEEEIKCETHHDESDEKEKENFVCQEESEEEFENKITNNIQEIYQSQRRLSSATTTDSYLLHSFYNILVISGIFMIISKMIYLILWHCFADNFCL